MTKKFNPNHHHRQSIRLRNWDYTAPGAYFVTICTYQRENLFDDDQLRVLVENGWQNIPVHPHARYVTLDEWVVMPNHVHGILNLHPQEQRISVDPKNEDHLNGAISGSVGAIIGNFKSLVTRRANILQRTPGSKVWQRGYYDRIIRNDRELNAIRQYILDNPQRWQEDRENLEAMLPKMRLNA